MPRLPIALALALMAALPARAGDVACLKVTHVAANDVLNLRREPDAGAAVVDVIPPKGHGLLRRMQQACTPSGEKASRQWCRVSYMNGNRIRMGWVKRHFVTQIPCPPGAG